MRDAADAVMVSPAMAIAAHIFVVTMRSGKRDAVCLF